MLAVADERQYMTVTSTGRRRPQIVLPATGNHRTISTIAIVVLPYAFGRNRRLERGGFPCCFPARIAALHHIGVDFFGIQLSLEIEPRYQPKWKEVAASAQVTASTTIIRMRIAPISLDFGPEQSVYRTAEAEITMHLTRRVYVD